MAKQADIIYRDDLVMSMINSKFISDHEGHLIIVPVKHFESIFDIKANYLARISLLAQHLARAIIDIYPADGIMLQQNNGPASGQHAFHYHLHIIPRFQNVSFFDKKAFVADLSARLPYVQKLKSFLRENPFIPG